LGYTLRKCRSRDPDALGYAGYVLIDAATNCVVRGNDAYDVQARHDSHLLQCLQIDGFANAA
jgi:hypothetical protein